VIFDETDPEQAMIVALCGSNIERITALAQQGVQLNLDRSASVLEFLLDQIAGDSEARLTFERDQAQSIADNLDSIEAQIRQAKITQGVATDPRVLQQINNKR